MTIADSDPWGYIPEELKIRYDEEYTSIPNAVRVTASRHGELEAIVDGELRLTFAGLEAAMLDCVKGMIALGIKSGDRVAIWAPNSARWILAALGIHGAGGVLVPVNTRFKGEEAAYILRRSGATSIVAVTDFLDNDYLGMLRDVDPDSPALQQGRVIVASGEAIGGDLGWDEFIAAGAGIPDTQAQASIDAVTSESLSDIMFTSGTTGYPKGVMLTHGQSLRAHGWFAKVLDFTPGDRYLIIPPFFHTFGYKAGWMACIVHGVTAIPLSAFSVDGVMRLVQDERVSILLGPPTLFQGILDPPDGPSYDLSSIRVTMASSTVVPPALVSRIREELGSEITQNAYGLTEATSMTTLCLPKSDSFEDITTTVGRAGWDVELRVVDEAGKEVPRGTPGELLIRGYTVTQGYWQEPEKTAEAIDAEGWLHSGDIVVMDERGYVKITDRKKDVIIVGGFNVYPAEVERILGEHPEVESIAVVGTFDDRLGEVPVAFVVRREASALTESEFLGWARQKIANFKAPRKVVFVEEMPRNASMKVLKNQLRDAISS